MNNGLYPSILIEARTISEGWQKAMIACKDYGCRSPTPKHKEGMSLGYDADINVRVISPLEDLIKNQRHKLGLYDLDTGLMQYILEVTHGIHNHWKKHPEDLKDQHWGYTYNERFVDQIPFVLARIKHDWETKKRISGRDYQFNTWRPNEDIILEQEDPPCLQRGHLRFIQDEFGIWTLNYITDWRSRDLAKAWLENNIAQIKLMKLLAQKVSVMLDTPIKIGCYTDRSSSLHIYGKYVDEDRIEDMIERMKKGRLEDFLIDLFTEDQTKLKRLIAAQTDAEDKSLGKNLSEDGLEKLGYNLDTFPYPADWDSWPKEWDRNLDKARKILTRNIKKGLKS